MKIECFNTLMKIKNWEPATKTSNHTSEDMYVIYRNGTRTLLVNKDTIKETKRKEFEATFKHLTLGFQW